MNTSLNTGELLAQAITARSRAYAPYSQFAVGAALATKSGVVFTGVNVENASFGATLCAERSALAAAVSAGHREFTGLALATAGGYAPCGICRQSLLEFCADLPIFLVDADSPAHPTQLSLAELLPHSFRLPPSPTGE